MASIPRRAAMASAETTARTAAVALNHSPRTTSSHVIKRKTSLSGSPAHRYGPPWHVPRPPPAAPRPGGRRKRSRCVAPVGRRGRNGLLPVGEVVVVRPGRTPAAAAMSPTRTLAMPRSSARLRAAMLSASRVASFLRSRRPADLPPLGDAVVLDASPSGAGVGVSRRCVGAAGWGFTPPIDATTPSLG